LTSLTSIEISEIVNVKLMNSIFFSLLLLITTTAGVSAQSAANAAAFQRCEADWLTAILNNDENWLHKLMEGKLSFIAAEKSGLDERQRRVEDLSVGLSSTQSKVRISGTIRVLSNEPGRSRSFQFLDTFNKKNGKWTIIATSLSEAAIAPDSIRSKPIEAELSNLENAWAQVDVTNDRSIFQKILAPEFTSTSIAGQVRSRDEWLAAWQYEGVKSATNTDVKVHVISDSLAVVTGTDETTNIDNSGRQVMHEDRFTDTWVRGPQGWQIIARQLTRLR
jgi:hypothetical protein